jgi:broad specificity phosphatase PhoE
MLEGSGTGIILVRHGHVEGIVPPRFRGRADLPLTEHGVRQVAATRDYLSGVARPVAIYTSPLSRCVRTGEILGEPYALAPRMLEDLSDIDYGAWQGQTFDAVRVAAPEIFPAWLRTPHLVAIPGGEALYDVAARVAGVLRTLVSRHHGEAVCLVGHDSVNRVMLLLALELPLSRYWSLKQSPCGVSMLEQNEDGAWVAASINGTAHLGSLAGMPPSP